jgi:NADH-quinone oxidoreductase subunit N
LFYLAAYGAMNLGAFGVLLCIDASGTRCRNVSDLQGLGSRSPVLALAMTLCMLSLLGMPPLGGFVGKVFLFKATLEAGYAGLVVVAIVNSVASAVYYIGVIRAMYFDEGGLEVGPVHGHIVAGTVLAVGATLLLGLAPGPILEAARAAAAGVLLGP